MSYLLRQRSAGQCSANRSLYAFWCQSMSDAFAKELAWQKTNAQKHKGNDVIRRSKQAPH
jgi:hypothetical protein